MTKTKNLLIYSLLVAFLLPSTFSQSAQAATCRNAGSKSDGIKVGSQVDGDLLTICANKKLIQQLKSKLIVKQKAAAKPSMKPTVKPLPTAKKLVVKKLPLAKPKPKSQIRVSRKVKNNSGLALFRPAKPVAGRSPLGRVDVLQSVILSTPRKTHQGFTYLLGRLVRVRFIPNRSEWNFGDSSEGTGFSTSHEYQSRGIFFAKVRVRYRVSYRFSGGSWVTDPDQIWLTSKALQIPVGVDAPAAGGGYTVLVLNR